MNRNWTRFLAMLLALVMVTSVLAACGNDDPGETTKPAVSIENGKYTENVTVTHAVKTDAATKFMEGDNYDDNVWTRYISEKLGIDLEVAWSADGSTDAYGQKLTMSIANEDLPDIFNTYYSTYYEAASGGMLTDMEPYIEQYGSDLLKEILERNKDLVEGCRVDGKLYCIPGIGPSYEVNSQFLWIRQDWLDAVGMKAPTTWDELVKVAEAFTTQDPDGNGVDDTYGLGLSGTSPWWGGVGSFDGIAEAFHATCLQNWVKDENGQIVYGSTQPQMKDALAAAADLYARGILDPEFMTKGIDEVVADIYNNKIGMTFGFNWAGYWPLLGSVEANPAAVWTPYPYVSADDQPAKTAIWWPVDTYYCVAASAEHPEAAVLILNLYLETMNSTDTAVLEKYNYSGEYSNYLLCPVRMSNGSDEFNTYNAVKGVAEGTVDPESLTGTVRANYEHIQAYLDGNVSDYGYWSQLGIGGCMGIVLEDYIPNDRIALTEIHGGFPESVSAEMGLIQGKEIEYIAKIVSGALPVSAFEDWLADFQAMGGDNITKVVNDTFNSK